MLLYLNFPIFRHRGNLVELLGFGEMSKCIEEIPNQDKNATNNNSGETSPLSRFQQIRKIFSKLFSNEKSEGKSALHFTFDTEH